MAKLDPTTMSATTSPAQEKQRTVFAGRWRSVIQGYGALIACVLLFILNCIFTPHFLSLQTVGLNLQQMSTIAIVAIGMTLVIATGGIDLSVGSVMAIAGVLAPLIFLHLDTTLGIILSFIAPLLIAAICGLFNGWLVARIRVQPIIATLILFIAGRGIAQVLTNGAGLPFTMPGFQWIGQGSFLHIPIQAYIMLALVGLFVLIVQRTTFGRYLQATGGNASAARLAGVPVTRTTWLAYGISGVLAGLAGLIVVALNSNSDPSSVGLNYELSAIAAVAIGGTPLIGGQARVFGTFVGALITQLIYTILVGNNVPQAVALVVNAIIILAAVYIQTQRRKA
ncbi:ABC transporter permease [Dictyobacter kobayashii]|uniref:Sugar ABC transporter permease n=1 Tax=Dictyobacter kobayashii TaxID=2014872 RepID=A0A402AYT8_9CHLR|nr:ABC transporter permease [Dictyobacter kobayashii]GCE24276.1 sugar ABC transporter permease [Dictyobacter kobayashii]